ncbi:MAG: flagellar export chaperone FliS [Solirubrobacteraceae bacterium]|nr:flagellar export chaperone FliS [Patulibacter sp.]
MYRSATPNAYRESAVLTASPVQLVVMLYDGANRFLMKAIALHEHGEPIRANEPTQRAVAIVEELLATIDIERGGEIAPRLQGIYVFCLKLMGEARYEQSPDKLRQVKDLLGELRESWATLAAQAG